MGRDLTGECVMMAAEVFAGSGRRVEAEARVKKPCKGNPVWEAEAKARLEPIRADAKRLGVGVGTVMRANELVKLEGITLRDEIARAIYKAYYSGHETGRAFQRRVAKRRIPGAVEAERRGA